MYHVYCDNNRVTHQPISYNYLLKSFFSKKSLVDFNRISTLPIGKDYNFEEFKIVRVS